MIELNKHLVNPRNICYVSRYYQITATPGEPGQKDYFRMYILFVGGVKDNIQFETAEQMDLAYEKLKLYEA